MNGINVWGIFTFVLPIVIAIIAGFISVMIFLVKGIFKFLGGTSYDNSKNARRSN